MSEETGPQPQREMESVMSEADHVKVENIFKGGMPGCGDGGGNNWATILPALMAERKQNDTPWASILPALMAERRSGGGYGGGWDGGCGFGGMGLGSGFLGGILGGLLFNRRGGLFGDEGGGRGGETERSGRETERHIDDVLVLRDLGEVKAEVQQVGSTVTNAVNAAAAAASNANLQQTIQIQEGLASIQLATQQGLCGVKDTVQTTSTVLLQALNAVNNNVSEQGCQTRAAVSNDGDKTRAMLFQRFQLEDSTRINELNARVVELQAEGRRHADNAELRLQISNNNTATAAQAQGQAQQQQQFQTEALRGIISALGGLQQSAHATNTLVNTGFMNRTRQDANPTNVNA
jgi:hypothetical protein